MHDLKKPPADRILSFKMNCIARKGVARKSSKPMVDPNSLALLSLRDMAVECIPMFSHRPAMYTPVHHNMSYMQDACTPILPITLCGFAQVRDWHDSPSKAYACVRSEHMYNLAHGVLLRLHEYLFAHIYV